MDDHHSWYIGSMWHKDWPHQVYVGQWPIFYGPVSLLHILKTIWWRNVVLGIMDQCDTKVVLLKYMYMWVLLCSIDFAFYDCHRFKLFVYIKTFDLKINVVHCDLYFMVQWFCLISWRLFYVWMSFFGIMSLYDPSFDLDISAGHCDLYFVVQWFCLTSWRLFDVWTSYWDYESVWHIWPQNKSRSLKIYVIVHWFCLLWGLNEIHIWFRFPYLPNFSTLP